MAAIAPTFEEIQAESGPPAFEDIAPLSPDPEQQDQQIQSVLDLSQKHGISPVKAQRRQTLINQLFNDDDYEEAVTSRQEEKANAGAAGYWTELIDATARGSARVGAAFSRALTYSARTKKAQMAWYASDAQQKAMEARAKEYEQSAELLWEVAKNPALAAQNTGAANKAINLIGETLPYITATTAAYVVAGPLGGFAVGGLVEGHSSYQEAIDEGEDKETAKWIGLGVGIVNGAIEAVGGKFTGEFFEKIIKKKVVGKIRQAGALFTMGTLVEALEEGSQEISTLTGEEVYKDVSWKEWVTRIAASMAGGAFLGGSMRAAQIGSKRLIQETKESPQLEDNLTQTIKETTGLPEPEARKVAQDAIQDKFHPEEQEEAEKPAQAVGKAPSVPVAGPIAETGAVEPTAAAEQAGKPTLEASADKAIIFEGELFHGTDEAGAKELLKGKPFKISTTSGGGEMEGADFGNGAYFVLQSGMTGPYGDIELKAKTTKPLRLYEATTIEEKGFVTKNWRELAKQAFDGAVFRQGGITEGTEYENEVVLFDPKGKVETLYDTGQTEDENAYQAKQNFTKAPPAPAAEVAGQEAPEPIRIMAQRQANKTNRRVGIYFGKDKNWHIFTTLNPPKGVREYEAVTPEITPVSELKTGVEKAEVAEQSPEGPERKVSRAAQRIQEEAIAKDLAESLGELPTYETMPMAEQARMAAEEIGKDYENAKQMAYGKVAPASGLRPASIYRAVAVKARTEGDVETLRNLAVVHPQISLELTAMGQAIKAADVGTLADPVKAMQDIQKTKEKAVAKKRKIKDIKRETTRWANEAKQEIKKKVTHRQSWNEFVETIRC